MTGIDKAIVHFRFILENADMGYPLALAAMGFAAVLPSRNIRGCLSDGKVSFLFSCTFLLWALLIPWSAMWLPVMESGRPGPLWAALPIYAVFLLWPALAARLVFRMKNARGATIFYVLCNAPGWLLGCFVAVMAVGGDWI